MKKVREFIVSLKPFCALLAFALGLWNGWLIGHNYVSFTVAGLLYFISVIIVAMPFLLEVCDGQ